MFQKIDHVNISVKDIAVSAHWYETVFGFKVVEAGLNMSGSKYAIVENQDTMICMSEHPDWKEPGQDLKNQHQIFHFGFRVLDLDLWRSKIHMLGLVLTAEEIRYQRSISWYVLDPNGYEIEVSYLLEGGRMF